MRSKQEIFFDLICGRTRGLFADVARAFLSLASLLYSLIIRIRNVYYDAVPGAVRRLQTPVISIGNITVGGTGKTPMAIEIADLVRRRGHRVAILTRGYKGAGSKKVSKDEPEPESDEALLLARRCPQALVVVNPDRVAGGIEASRAGCDVMILDDGFQHRRLGRDLDIVLVDATAPFGYGAMLPRGLLREPRTSLRRATLLVLTRSNLIKESDRRILRSRLERLSGELPIVEASHRVSSFEDLSGEVISVDQASDIRAVIFAGIANFEGFRHTVEELGVEIAAAYEYPDHHPYESEELQGLRDVAETLEANAIITTEKDAVKLVGRWEEGTCRLLVMTMSMMFEPEGETILHQKIDALLSRIPSRKSDPASA